MILISPGNLKDQVPLVTGTAVSLDPLAANKMVKFCVMAGAGSEFGLQAAQVSAG